MALALYKARKSVFYESSNDNIMDNNEGLIDPSSNDSMISGGLLMEERSVSPMTDSSESSGGYSPNSKVSENKKEKDKKIKRRAPPTCTRCKNHDIIMYYRNGHKRKCPYRNCRCIQCCVTAHEQRVMAHQTALTRQLKQDQDDEETGEEQTYLKDEDNEKSDSKQIPQCSRCRNHNQLAYWKGHKNQCPYRHCQCDRCIYVLLRKKLREKKNGIKLDVPGNVNNAELLAREKKEQLSSSHTSALPPIYTSTPLMLTSPYCEAYAIMRGPMERYPVPFAISDNAYLADKGYSPEKGYLE